MDTFSHGGWGYAALRWRGRRAAWAGALAGAAPDLLYFIPSAVERVVERGPRAFFVARDPGIWRAAGPPLPPELMEAYHRYYVWTHSLVVLALAAGLLYLAGKRSWLWLALPYALHIVMDVPTHERYLTRPFHPLSDWSFFGLSWSDPRIFWPNVVLLVLVLLWQRRRYRSDANGAGESNARAAPGDGEAR